MTCVRQRVEVRHEEVPFTLQGNGYAEVRALGVGVGVGVWVG